MTMAKSSFNKHSLRSCISVTTTTRCRQLIYLVLLYLFLLPTVTNSTDEVQIQPPVSLPTPIPSMHHMDYIRSRATLHNKKAEQYIHDLKEEMKHDHTDKNPRNNDLVSKGRLTFFFRNS